MYKKLFNNLMLKNVTKYYRSMKKNISYRLRKCNTDQTMIYLKKYDKYIKVIQDDYQNLSTNYSITLQRRSFPDYDILKCFWEYVIEVQKKEFCF